MLIVLLFLASFVVAAYAVLWLFQRRLMYFPQRYRVLPGDLPPSLKMLRFRTAQGEQCAFVHPPPSGRLERLWVVFPGNAMTALDRAEWALIHPDYHAAFLLIDYPGYGYSQGAPSQAAIAEASDAAFAVAAATLGIAPTALAGKCFVLGHSMGCATGLEFACRHPVAGAVLTAPFTTVRDLAARMFGPPVRLLIRDDFDNVARLAELAAIDGAHRPQVVILHGREDELVDFRFGERLAASAPWVEFAPIVGGHHNDLYETAPELIRQAMLEVSGVTASASA